jgi:threonine/homoserine/homoserine lactone efflux protein
VTVTAVVVTGLAGVVFGLALAAPPGPMNAVIAEESVLRGWSAGFLAGLGAMTADAVFFVLAVLGVVTAVERLPLLRAGMVGAGGLLMLYFAYGAASDASGGFGGGDDSGSGSATRSDRSQAGDEADPRGSRDRSADARGFRKALVLALTNPYQIVFWLTVGVGLLEPGRVDVLGYTPYVGDSLAGLLVVETGSPALLVGLFGGIVVWITGFPAALVGVGRRVDRFAPAVAYASSLVLVVFGVLFLVDALGTLGVGLP